MNLENANIPGVDVQAALGRLRNNTALYTKLLNRFLEGAELAALQNALKEGTAAQAVLDAHTIKGTAANLSITGIQQKAAELESLLKAETMGVNDTHRALAAEIEAMYKTLAEDCKPYL